LVGKRPVRNVQAVFYWNQLLLTDVVFDLVHIEARVLAELRDCNGKIRRNLIRNANFFEHVTSVPLTSSGKFLYVFWVNANPHIDAILNVILQNSCGIGDWHYWIFELKPLLLSFALAVVLWRFFGFKCLDDTNLRKLYGIINFLRQKMRKSAQMTFAICVNCWNRLVLR